MQLWCAPKVPIFVLVMLDVARVTLIELENVIYLSRVRGVFLQNTMLIYFYSTYKHHFI